jgi:hypothetical protein
MTDGTMSEQRPESATRRPRLAARLGAGVAAAATVLALVGACGGDGDADSTSSSVATPAGLPTSLPTGLPTALPSSLSLPGLGADVPAGFPIPPGAKSEVTTVAGGKTLRLSGVSVDRAFAFYRDALPKAGYKIVSDEPGNGALPGSLSFTGHGVTGGLSGTEVAGVTAIVVTFVKSG